MRNHLSATKLLAQDISHTLHDGTTVDDVATYSVTRIPCLPSLSIKMPITILRAPAAARVSIAGPTIAVGKSPVPADQTVRAPTVTNQPHPLSAVPAKLGEQWEASSARRIKVFLKVSQQACLEIGIGAPSRCT